MCDAADCFLLSAIFPPPLALFFYAADANSLLIADGGFITFLITSVLALICFAVRSLCTRAHSSK
jgi:hypothetical protein